MTSGRTTVESRPDDMNRTRVRYLRTHSCPVFEAQNGDVREPGAVLPAVDAEPLQAGLDVLCEGRGVTRGVAADDHAHTPGLTVVLRHQLAGPGGGRRRTQLAGDGTDLSLGAGAEEGEGCVQVLGRDDAASVQVLGLPGGEVAHDLVGKLQRAEEPDSQA